MPNEILMQLGALGEHEANKERLRREIMAVDNVEWDAAGGNYSKLRRLTKQV